jgi:hypothetical protein
MDHVKLDMTNQAHREALRWAADARANGSNQAETRRIAAACPVLPARTVQDVMEGGQLLKAAFAVVDTPSIASEVLRDLFRVLDSSVEIEHFRGVQWRLVYYLGGVRMWRAVNFADGSIIPGTINLIIALLGIHKDAPNRHELVLAALQGAA